MVPELSANGVNVDLKLPMFSQIKFCETIDDETGGFMIDRGTKKTQYWFVGALYSQTVAVVV